MSTIPRAKLVYWCSSSLCPPTQSSVISQIINKSEKHLSSLAPLPSSFLSAPSSTATQSCWGCHQIQILCRCLIQLNSRNGCLFLSQLIYLIVNDDATFYRIPVVAARIIGTTTSLLNYCNCSLDHKRWRCGKKAWCWFHSIFPIKNFLFRHAAPGHSWISWREKVANNTAACHGQQYFLRFFSVWLCVVSFASIQSRGGGSTLYPPPWIPVVLLVKEGGSLRNSSVWENSKRSWNRKRIADFKFPHLSFPTTKRPPEVCCVCRSMRVFLLFHPYVQ